MNTKLILFPFAGGNSYSFKEFTKELSRNMTIQCHCIEYPGRGTRIKEPLLTSLEDFVEDVLFKYKHLFQGNFHFFGYSMGAIIARLVIDKLIENELPSPINFFAAACPSLRYMHTSRENIAHLPENDFIEKLKSYGGIHEQILASPDLLRFLSRIIRADIKAYENFQSKKLTPLNCPIYIYGGKEDHIKQEELEHWQEDSTGEFKMSIYEGGHFFIFENLKQIGDSIKYKIIVS